MIFLPKNYFSIVRETGKTTYPSSKFKSVGKYEIVDIESESQYHIKELIEKEIEFSNGGILAAFSNAQILQHTVHLESGLIERINLSGLKNTYGISESYKLFAVGNMPALVHGNINRLEHLIPSVFMITDDYLLIGAFSHPTSPKNFNSSISLSFYFHKPHDESWKEVLYKSLYEFSQKNFNIALVLLFSSIDILTKILLRNNYPKRERTYRRTR